MNILDTIDNAIADWGTSPDAMRWTPDTPKPPTVPPIRIEPPRIDTAALTAAMQAFGRAVEAVGRAFAVPVHLLFEPNQPTPHRRPVSRKGAARWRKSR